jgi:hypothetical protein
MLVETVLDCFSLQRVLGGLVGLLAIAVRTYCSLFISLPLFVHLLAERFEASLEVS